MGVPRFYGRVIGTCFTKAKRKQRPEKVTVFGIDFIGILYVVYGKLNNEGREWDINRFLNEMEWFLLNLIRSLTPQRMVMIMIDGTPPLAKIDQQRKRRYRAVIESSNADNTEEPKFAPFPTSSFSPGTDVMFEVEDRIKKIITYKRTSFPAKVMFSSFLEQGEGEHKMMQYIRQYCNAKDTIVVYGLDADLIFLCSMLPFENIFICRDNTFVDENMRVNLLNKGESKIRSQQLSTVRSIEYFDINIFKQMLADRRISVREFVFTFFLFGNDFLPGQVGFIFMDTVSSIVLKELEGRTFFDSNGEVNLPEFIKFISNFYDVQQQNIPLVSVQKGSNLRRRDTSKRDTVNYPIIYEEDFEKEWALKLTLMDNFPIDVDVADGSFDLLIEQEENGTPKSEESSTSKRQTKGSPDENIGESEKIDKTEDASDVEGSDYGEDFAEDEDGEDEEETSAGENLIHFRDFQKEVDERCARYIATFYWAFKYYTDHHSMNWYWVNWNDRAPTIKQIIEAYNNDDEQNTLFQKFIDKATYPKRLNFGVLEQLLLILPRDPVTGKPNDVLPIELHVFQMPYSPIFDTFPRKYHVLREGVLNDHEGHVHLPPIDIKRVEAMTKDHFYMTKKRYQQYQLQREPLLYFREEADFSNTTLEQETEKVEMQIEKVQYLDDLKIKKYCQVMGSEFIATCVNPKQRLFVRYANLSRVRIEMPSIKPVARDENGVPVQEQ